MVMGLPFSENVCHGGQRARTKEVTVPQLAPEHEDFTLAITG